MTHKILPRSSIRVLIVEDHVLFAESLELALSMEGYDVRRLVLPESGGSMSTILSAAIRAHPRIVLLDLDLGRFGNGGHLIGPMAGAGVSVVVITASTDRARWGECLRYGARKVMSKTEPLNDILATVRRLNEGLPLMAPDEREELLQLWHSERRDQQVQRARLERLTNREREVLGHLVGGRTVREIAREEVVSEATVRTQVKAILSKLEVSSQLAAVGIAHRTRWQPPRAESSRGQRSRSDQ
ncbi:response regulator transcription factor [Nocardioides sp.]|jgi:DNA-binding NarL/FixJ family response regulator|uniref:response regulator transcription factor n=1 Tax=Nocardioides sp. TaxID=35761 RepID=UPI0031FF3079|nr:LuxR family transcriptional regulator [Nocardioides sp.]